MVFDVIYWSCGKKWSYVNVIEKSVRVWKNVGNGSEVDWRSGCVRCVVGIGLMVRDC